MEIPFLKLRFQVTVNTRQSVAAKTLVVFLGYGFIRGLWRRVDE